MLYVYLLPAWCVEMNFVKSLTLFGNLLTCLRCTPNFLFMDTHILVLTLNVNDFTFSADFVFYKLVYTQDCFTFFGFSYFQRI